MANGRKLACESRSLVNARSLQFEWKKYCMGDYLWMFWYMEVPNCMEERERARIKVVQMDNLGSLLGTRSYVGWRKVWMKGLMQVFSSCLGILKEWRMVRLLKGHWFTEGLLIKKAVLDVGQERRMVYESKEWYRFARGLGGNDWSLARVMNLWVSLNSKEVWSTYGLDGFCGQSYNLLRYKGEILVRVTFFVFS